MSLRCSSGLIDDHRAISSSVRRHPRHVPSASSTQTLMQGEAGGSCDTALYGVELWGALAYSSNPHSIAQASQNNNLGSKDAMNPLNNHRQTLILGIVIAVIIAGAIGGFQLNWPG